MDEKSNIAVEKKNIRKRILPVRNEIPLKLREDKSNKILQTLYETDQYKEAKVILTYVDYQSEVITTPTIVRALAEKKQVFVPRVCRVCGAEPESGEMEFYRISDVEDLAEGYKGIREPICGERFLEETESYKESSVLMLMPGVVFDKYGHRIGYGKGFYDRYLKRLAEAGINVYKTALCYECQLIDDVPYERHDISVDLVITDNGKYENRTERSMVID